MLERDVREVFRNHIQERGMRHTHQRDVILAAFLKAEKHITVDDLFETVKRKDPGIGYATVHRNVQLLCECGLADEIKIGKQKTRYERTWGQGHHDHLICLVCGRFIEVKSPQIEKLQEKLAEGEGFFPLRHKLEIYGRCKDCR